MPNGDPDFDLEREESWFAPIAPAVERFATARNLLVGRYDHDAPAWTLRFNHPEGGQASIVLTHHEQRSVAIGSVWHVDCHDTFTRSLHRREPREVPREPGAVRHALEAELRAILAVPPGAWTEVATGYERIWGRYTREQFAALAPRLPDPVVDD